MKKLFPFIREQATYKLILLYPIPFAQTRATEEVFDAHALLSGKLEGAEAEGTIGSIYM